MSKNTNRIIASLFLLLFLSFQSGRMFCYHTHIFGNHIISHSHPFNNPDRQHTALEIETLFALATSSLTDYIAEAPSIIPSDNYIVILSANVVASPVNSFKHTTEGRAPPVHV